MDQDQDPAEVSEFIESVKRAQAGERQALAELCSQLRNHIESIISCRINNPATVRDLVQETYLRFLKSFQGINDPEKTKGYVAKVAVSVTKRYLAYHSKWKKIIVRNCSDWEDQSVAKTSSLPRAGGEYLIDRITMSEIIQMIPDKINRRLFQLKVEGKNYEEISHALAISKGSAKMRFKRTLDYLKTEIGE